MSYARSPLLVCSTTIGTNTPICVHLPWPVYARSAARCRRLCIAVFPARTPRSLVNFLVAGPMRPLFLGLVARRRGLVLGRRSRLFIGLVFRLVLHFGDVRVVDEPL